MIKILLIANLSIAFSFFIVMNLVVSSAKRKYNNKHPTVANKYKTDLVNLCIRELKIFIEGCMPVLNLFLFVILVVNFDTVVEKIYNGLESILNENQDERNMCE